MLYVLLFFAGILTILLPCILPLLPIVVGVSIAGHSRLRPLLTVLGMVISFVVFTTLLLVVLKQFVTLAIIMRTATFFVLWLFGIGFCIHKRAYALPLAALGSFMFIEHGVLAVSIAAIAGVLCMYFGPSIAADIQNLGSRTQNSARATLGNDNPITAFIVGLTLGLVWVPCAGPALGFALALVRDEPGIKAVLALTAYALGTAVPLLLVGYGGQWAVRSSRALTKYSGKVKSAAGVLLLISALALQFNMFEKLQILLLDHTSLGDIGTKIEERIFGDTFSRSRNSKPAVENEVKPSAMEPNVQLPILGKAPAFAPDGEWLNSSGLTQADLTGKVVLIDFWTYSCINCIRTLPYIQEYWSTFSTVSDKFVLIGVHAPEFAFEHSTKNVADAITRHGLTYPVVQDNNFTVWNSYNNRYWPAKYLIDANGNVRYTHFGEGNYKETAQAITQLLAEIGETASATISDPEKSQRARSHETYLGSRIFAALANKKDVPSTNETEYVLPAELALHTYALGGTWQLDEGSDFQTLRSDTGTIRIKFIGNEINLVMGPSNDNTQTVTVSTDGNEQSTLPVLAKDSYQLWQGQYGEHELELVATKGLEIYAFTFGS